MEFILVNSVKLKIMLSSEDLHSLSVSAEALAPESRVGRAAIELLLERARLATGFDGRYGKLVIRSFPGKDGSCELFLTKKTGLLPEPEEEKNSRRKKRKPEPHGERQYIATGDIDSLTALCVRLHKESFEGESAFYYRKGRYYLVLSPACASESLDPFERETQNDRYFFLCEYAEVHFAHTEQLAVLWEHGECILAQKAVEILAKAFEST